LLAHCVLLAVGLLACGGGDPLEDALRRQAQGDFAGSIEPLRTVLEERPDDPEVNYLYGRALTATGQPSLAEWALRRAAQDPEWIVPAGSQLAVSALWVGNFNTAIDMSTQVLEVDPDNVDVLLTRAQAYGRSRLNSEKAIEEADRVLALDPTRTAAMEP
jgi:Tfp pilus assembly protein PilF